ncbi:MAG: YdcF family protein [Clostridia bacterium]|nr:YdcF family protein [Clostridia bacterium]
MKRSKKIMIIAAAIIAACGVLVAAINVYVVAFSSRYMFDIEELPEGKYDCILILGAGLRPDGTPSDMLRDRLDKGIELYRLGAADVLLLSGDRSGDHYDEVSAMKKYCISQGISEDVILCDEFGFHTFGSIRNTYDLDIFEKIIIVTQKYHLSRAVSIARGLGLDACGVATDEQNYRGQLYRDVREVMARTKDFFQTLNRRLMRIK